MRLDGASRGSFHLWIGRHRFRLYYLLAKMTNCWELKRSLAQSSEIFWRLGFQLPSTETCSEERTWMEPKEVLFIFGLDNIAFDYIIFLQKMTNCWELKHSLAQSSEIFWRLGFHFPSTETCSEECTWMEPKEVLSIFGLDDIAFDSLLAEIDRN
jgi:hypothetical protein